MKTSKAPASRFFDLDSVIDSSKNAEVGTKYFSFSSFGDGESLSTESISISEEETSFGFTNFKNGKSSNKEYILCGGKWKEVKKKPPTKKANKPIKTIKEAREQLLK